MGELGWVKGVALTTGHYVRYVLCIWAAGGHSYRWCALQPPRARVREFSVTLQTGCKHNANHTQLKLSLTLKEIYVVLVMLILPPKKTLDMEIFLGKNTFRQYVPTATLVQTLKFCCPKVDWDKRKLLSSLDPIWNMCSFAVGLMSLSLVFIWEHVDQSLQKSPLQTWQTILHFLNWLTLTGCVVSKPLW